MNQAWKREVFLGPQFEVHAMKIGNVGLESALDDIDYFDIVDIYVDKKGADQLRFKDRIELLRNGKGWIHLASGASFEIKKGTIKQVKLSTRFLQDKKTCRKDILEIFGKADTELVDDYCYSAFDYNIDANVLVYRKKKMFVFLDPETDRLKELRFGAFNESIYGKK